MIQNLLQFIKIHKVFYDKLENQPCIQKPKMFISS